MGAAKDGDYIRVTIEGTAQANGTYTLVHGEGGSWLAEFKDRHVGNGITVEKIERPVEVFKVGDTVRFKTEGSLVFTLGRGGYFDHLNSIWVGRHATFTSEHYEKVSIG